MTFTIKSEHLFYVVVLVVAIVLAAYHHGYFDGGRMVPSPSPSPSVIRVTQAEYDVVMSAFDYVGNEWTLSRFDSLKDAVQALSGMMGDYKDGINRTAQEQILGAFKENSDFLGVIENLKTKLKITGGQ